MQQAKQARRCQAGVRVQAHKLLVAADQLDPPKAAEATDALFAATYEEGKNVSDDAEIEKVGALMFQKLLTFLEALLQVR